MAFKQRTPEGALKQLICEWLDTQKSKCVFWVTQSIGIRGRKNNSRWSCKGISDINGIWQGKPLFIEVKVSGNKPSEDQVSFIENAKRHGAIAFVAYSLDDVVKELLQTHHD